MLGSILSSWMREENREVCKDRKNGQRLGEFRTILANEFEYVEKLCLSEG